MTKRAPTPADPYRRPDRKRSVRAKRDTIARKQQRQTKRQLREGR